MPPPLSMKMKELPERKHPRLKQYDYSQAGNYYITIHLADNSAPLSVIGRGSTSAEYEISLTSVGVLVQQQFLALETRYPNVKIDRHVIMPTHIHAIIRLLESAGASPRPTLITVIGAFKSLTTRAYNASRKTSGQKLFQTSFYETVLRNETAYVECCRYIDENPLKWWLKAEENNKPGNNGKNKPQP